MRAAVVDVLLALAVLSAWLAGFAFPRLSTALARLHCAAFVNVASGVAVTLAVFVADGPSTRALKTLALLAMLIVSGAASIHAAGRALTMRSSR